MQRAAFVLAVTILLDVLLGIAYALVAHIGVWTGLYFSVETGTTTGYGDVSPHGAGPHILAVLMMISVVPLYASVFSLITTGLTTKRVKIHIDARHEEVKQHVSDTISNHPSLRHYNEEDKTSRQ